MQPSPNKGLGDACRQYAKNIKGAGHPGLETGRSFFNPFRHFRGSRHNRSSFLRVIKSNIQPTRINLPYHRSMMDSGFHAAPACSFHR
jgi:hypothetical protein